MCLTNERKRPQRDITPMMTFFPPSPPPFHLTRTRPGTTGLIALPWPSSTLPSSPSCLSWSKVREVGSWTEQDSPRSPKEGVGCQSELIVLAQPYCFPEVWYDQFSVCKAEAVQWKQHVMFFTSLTDMTFTHEGNKTYTDSLVNFEKMVSCSWYWSCYPVRCLHHWTTFSDSDFILFLCLCCSAWLQTLCG